MLNICFRTAGTWTWLLSKIKPLIAIGYKVIQFDILFSCEMVFKRLSLSFVRPWS